MSIFNNDRATNKPGLHIYNADSAAPAIVTDGANASISGSASSTGSFGVLTVGTSNKYETFAASIEGTKGLRINHTGTTWDDQALRIDTAITTGRGLGIEGSALTTGDLVYLASDSSNTGAHNVVSIVQNHASAVGSVGLRVRQDAIADAAVFMGGEGKEGRVGIWADEGDDNADKFSFVVDTDGLFGLQDYAAGSWAYSWYDKPSDDTFHLSRNLILGAGMDVSGSSTSTGSFGSGYIDNKLGIGTTSPGYKLDVLHTGDDNPALYVKNSNGDGNGTWDDGALIQSWVGDTDGIDLRNSNDGDYWFGNKQQGNGIFMYDGTGGVCITYAGTVVCRIDSSGGLEVATGALGVGVTPSGTSGRIDASNDIVAYSSSDIRFKKNTTPISDALFKVQQIQGIEFDWIPSEEHHGYEGHDVGVIAQEVIKVLPEVVTTRESGYMAVKYERMIPLLIEAIKEQQEQIDELKQQIKEIKDA